MTPPPGADTGNVTDAVRPLPARRKPASVLAALLGLAGVGISFAGVLVAMNGGGWLVLGVGGVLLAATYAARQFARAVQAPAAKHWQDDDDGEDDDAPWEPHAGR